MRKPRELTHEEILLAQEWRRQKYPWQKIADAFEVGRDTLRRQVDPNYVVPEYRNYKTFHRPEPRVEVPESVLEERSRAYDCDVSLSVALLGDPRPTRSALDKRNALGQS